MQIATPDSADEASNLLALVNRNPSMFDAQNYLGASTTVPGQKTSWYRVNTGMLINFNLQWATAEPNNLGNNEQCLSIQPNSGYNDWPCSGAALTKFMCERSVPPINYTR